MTERRKKGETSLSTNAWMATYTDLMILLLTFFVLLLSLSTIDKRRKRLAINSFVGAFGFKPGGQSILGEPRGLNITMESAPLVLEDVKFEKLANVALKHELESNINIMRQHDRIVISINNRLLFKPGSYEINPESYAFILELSDVLKEISNLIELRGYTDQAEMALEEEPFRYSMFLSAKRAFSVFQFLKDIGGIPSENMVAHGFGNNIKGNRKNGVKEGLSRQVEIIIDYNDDVPFKYKKYWKKTILDFKGFLFRTPVHIYEKKYTRKHK